MTTDAKFAQIFEHADKLPTLPGIAIRILEAVKKKSVGAGEIAEILSADPPLSAKVLKTVNSPYFGLNGSITSVGHAVSLLGIEKVKTLALSFSLVRKFNGERKDEFDYAAFWKDSLTHAVVCRSVAEKIMPSTAEDLFFLGLLSDIGALAINNFMPTQYSLVLKEKHDKSSSLFDSENRILGFSHAEVGSELIKRWGLPESFYYPILFHHKPQAIDSTEQKYSMITKTLHIAGLFSDLISLSDKATSLKTLEDNLTALDPGNGLKPEALAKQVFAKTSEIFPMFDIKYDDQRDYAQIVDEARETLIELSSGFITRTVSQEREIEDLKRQMTRDGLTRLLNFQAFQDMMDKEFYRAKRYGLPLALLLIDIDDFKKVNDTYGHLAGDEILRNVARTLNESLRESDIAARYGGEEFAVILTETGLDGAVVVAERVRVNVGGLTTEYEPHYISVTISIDVAGFVADFEGSRNEFVNRADKALYEAKNTGKNRCCVF